MRSMTEGVLLSAKLPQSPFGGGCFPNGKTPRDALRLVRRPSPRGLKRLQRNKQRDTDGAARYEHIFRYSVGATIGRPQPYRSNIAFPIGEGVNEVDG